MDFLLFLSSRKKRREKVVERLLAENKITASEAVLLLSTIERISIAKLEMSSGAKIVAGDDNETTNR